MTPEIALSKLKQLQVLGDTEIAHSCADDVLCELLHSLGYTEIVDAFLAIEKWYA